MSHSSLPLNSKLFQLTSLSCALALAGCGGGDGTDILAPKPNLGVQPGGSSGGNDNTGGGTGGSQVPTEEADFQLQSLYTTPANIELSDEAVTFTVTVKAVDKKSGSAVISKQVSLSVENSENNGVSIEGLSDQTTNDKGEATYELKLNPNVINNEQKAALLASGIKLKASAKRQNGSIVEQLHTVSVRKKGSGDGTQFIESQLSIKPSLVTTSVSNNKLNPYGDTAVLSIQTKDSSGALAVGVTVGASILDIKGVSIDSSSQVTDSQGMARFNIKIDNDLTKDERDNLIRSGLFYSINIQEKNGATKKFSDTLAVASPISDYNLSLKGNSSPVNAFGDSQQLLINATPMNSNVPTKIEGSKVSITLNDTIEGVTLSSNELVFNSQGQALVTLNIAKNLTAAARDQIAKTGIGYTVSLTEPNYSTTVKGFSSSAYIPKAQNQVSFVSNSKARLSSFGSTVEVIYRVNDKNNAPVADQTVIASLPKDLADKGLLLFNNSAQQTTNAQGQVKYTVFIPSGLSPENRALLEKSGGFVINVQAVEASGASSETSSERIQITADSETLLTSKTVPGIVNILKDQFQIQVTGKRADSKAANNRSVRLSISNPELEVETNDIVTDKDGVAIFTVYIDPTLTQAQKEALVKSGITYQAALTDEDGIASSNFKAQVEMPEVQYQINFDTLTNNQILSAGGSATLTFRVNNKQGGVVQGQDVVARLPESLTSKGLISLTGSNRGQTDEKGEISFTVRVPTGLNSQQRAALEVAERLFLSAQVIEPTGAVSNTANAPILIKSGKIELVTSSTPQILDITKDESFTITVIGRYPDSSAALGKSVKLSIDKPTIFTIKAGDYKTDEKGKSSFEVGIDPKLTEAQKDAFVASGIKYKVTVVDENGIQSEVTNTIKVTRPAAPVTSVNFASILSPSISEFGGSGLIKVKLGTKNASEAPISKKGIKLELDAQALSYGVAVKNNSAITDFNGEATFEVTIPESLSAEKRAALKRDGITYRAAYEENGVTYSSANQQVTIITPVVALTVLNAPTKIDNRPGFVLNDAGERVTISAQLSNQSENSQVAGQPVRLAFDNKSLAQLLTVNNQIGSAEIAAVSAADGTVSFDVIVPNNLSQAQKDQFKSKVLTATLTETLTGKTQQVKVKVQPVAAGLSLISTQSKALNLAGGETQIEVTAQNTAGNVVANQKVFFALPASIASQGVTLLSDSQITNESGKAVFTLAVPNNLNDAQKAAIGSSFNFALSAVDKFSNQIVTQAGQVNTIQMASNGTQESLSVGANKVVSTKGDTFKVFVRVADTNGAIANRDVRLNIEDPIKTGVTITNNTAKTNGDGVATFDLKLEPGANVNQALLEKGIKLTARTTTTENLEINQDYIVAVDTTTIDNYQILVSSDKSTLNTGGDQTKATFRVTDGKGGVLQGVPVQLSINNLETSGAALTTPSVVSTDSEGKIDVGVLLTANSINARLNHEIKIDAKIITPVYDANGDVTLTAREEKSLILSAVGTKIDLNASATRLKDGDTTAVTTQITDGSGLAIANTTMELIDEAKSVVATTTADADGKAVFNLKEDQLSFDNNGNLRLFARAVGENRVTLQRSTASINLIKDSRAGISFTHLKPIYDVDTPQAISIQIRTDSPEQAAALVGKKVNVQTSLGKFANNDVITEPVITANNVNGNNIDISVQLNSTLAGTAVLQATVLDENLQNGTPRYQVIVDTRFRATTPTKMLLQPVKMVINPGSSTEVVAIVKDKNDAPVEGQTVVFSRSTDSSAGRLSAATAVTDSKGEARVVYQANANSPIGGVTINVRLLTDTFGIGTKTTNITVSKEAVYTTLAFGSKLSSDNIYYTVQGSISVMDGSGRAVANQEVSIKSYAIEYAQGKVCALDTTVSGGGFEPSSELSPIVLNSGWKPTEDPEYNYILDKNADMNGNGKLDPINPVAIIGGTVADDGYSFVTNNEGRADFAIRYPIRYSNWVKVRFDASTFVQGSENVQSINYNLPTFKEDLFFNGTSLETPWVDNTSPFGDGGALCVNSLQINIDDVTNKPTVSLSPYSPNYQVFINGKLPSSLPQRDGNSFVVSFDEVLKRGSTEVGAIVSVTNNGFTFNKKI